MKGTGSIGGDAEAAQQEEEQYYYADAEDGIKEPSEERKPRKKTWGFAAHKSTRQPSSSDLFDDQRGGPQKLKKGAPVPREIERLPSVWKREYAAHSENRSVLQYWRRNIDK